MREVEGQREEEGRGRMEEGGGRGREEGGGGRREGKGEGCKGELTKDDYLKCNQLKKNTQVKRKKKDMVGTNNI